MGSRFIDPSPTLMDDIWPDWFVWWKDPVTSHYTIVDLIDLRDGMMEGSSDKSSQFKNVINNSWGVGLFISVVYSSHFLDELHIQYIYIYIWISFSFSSMSIYSRFINSFVIYFQYANENKLNKMVLGFGQPWEWNIDNSICFANRSLSRFCFLFI